MLGLTLDAAWVAYAAVSALLGLYALHRLSLCAAAWRARGSGAPADRHLDPDGAPAELPWVTVQLPLYNERCVAERLIDAACALDWPRDRLEIQVLDDSTDLTSDLCAARAAAWRTRGVDVVHLRRPRRDGFKAGALQAGLVAARGELVLVLDADFVPQVDLLRRAVGAFADPRVAMVQCRWEHLNRASGALTQVQALLLDGHFGVEQRARAANGRFFNFNGTAGLWRRAAIEDAGGWHCDTLTEDLDLSYRALLRGWRFVYRPDLAVPGELPADIVGFKSQQFRWAKGSVQVARKLLPAVARARVRSATRLEAFFHLTHNVPYALTAALGLLAVPALALRDGPRVAPALNAALAGGALAVTAAYAVTARRAVAGRLGAAAALAVLARVPQLLALTAGISLNQARAVLEGASGRPSEFVRTPKQGLVDGAAGASAPAPARAYRVPAGLMPLVELAAAAWCALGLAFALHAGRLVATPVLALYAIGFGAVGATSLIASLRRSPGP